MINICFRGEAFRPAYKVVNELKSHFPTSPLLLLTATCTPAIHRAILKKLDLDATKLHMETSSPDR